jgi:hypothetical protein
MFKYLTLSIFITCTLLASAQNIKKFSGPFSDSKQQSGTAEYSYYEDPNTHEYIKEGLFTYTFDGVGDYKGYKQTITGNFVNGLKNGLWTYTIQMTDFGFNNPYFTGTVSLVANYKMGYAHGNWKETQSLKSRKKFISYGTYVWDAFGPLKNMNISFNFNNGSLVGEVLINDENANFKATGQFNDQSLCTGTWLINDMGWGINRELIYKDNFLYEFIARGNNGQVEAGTAKYQKGYDALIAAQQLSAAERYETGTKIDTSCGGDNSAAINNIQQYFKKILTEEYFLYKVIGGDLTAKEGFKGGCELTVKKENYIALSENSDFKHAEEFYNEKKYLQALELYYRIKPENTKPSERNKLTTRIEELAPIVETFVNEGESNKIFFIDNMKFLRDSLNKDFQSINSNFSSKKVFEYNSYSYKYEEKQPIYIQNFPYDCDCKKPWLEKDNAIAKKCYNLNLKFYFNGQRHTHEALIHFADSIQEMERWISKSYISGQYKGRGVYVCNISRNEYSEKINRYLKEYNDAKKVLELENEFVQLQNKVKELNEVNKKKTIFKAFNAVIDDYNAKIETFPPLSNSEKLFNESNQFMKKIIELYAIETKEIEKKIKDLETPSDIYKSLME